MNISKIIPIIAIGAGLLFLTQKKEGIPAPTGGIDKTREVSITTDKGGTYKVEVPKDSNIKHTTTLGGTPQIEVYRPDGTLQAVYSLPSSDFKEIDAKNKNIIQETGKNLTSQIKVNMESKIDGKVVKNEKILNLYTGIDPTTGKTITVTDPSKLPPAGSSAPPGMRWNRTWGKYMPE